MQEDRKELHKKILLNLGLALAVILAVFFVVPPLLRFFLPLIVAWILALLASPVIRFLERRIKIMREHGTALVIVLVLVGIGALIYALCAVIFYQLKYWLTDLPGIYETVITNLQQVLDSLHSRYHFIPNNIHTAFSGNKHNINDYVMTALNGMLEAFQSGSFSKVGSVASSVMDFLVYAILTILSAYFMTVEKDNIVKAVGQHMPEGVKNFFNRVKEICARAIGGYFKAHFKIMVVIFFICVIPFTIMGIRFSFLLAVLIAIVDFLPFLGAGSILIPWAVYQLITGSFRYAMVLGVLYVVILIVRQVLEPKFIGDSIGTSPFETLIFMLLGYRIGGVLGLIFGIPVGMIILACYREGMFDRYIQGIKILAEDINEYRKY